MDCPSSTQTVINGAESSCGSDVEIGKVNMMNEFSIREYFEPEHNVSIVGSDIDVIDRETVDSKGKSLEKPDLSCKRNSDEDPINAENIVVKDIVVTGCRITHQAPIIVTDNPSIIYLKMR